jgi:hypothetical protein
MRIVPSSLLCGALCACGPTEGTWVGSADVEIFGHPVSHRLRLQLAEGTSQTGERALDGVGTLTQDKATYDVDGSAPWRGRRVELDLVPAPEHQDFVDGGGVVRPDLSFVLDGKVRRNRFVGRLFVEQYNDTWDASIELDRVD